MDRILSRRPSGSAPGSKTGLQVGEAGPAVLRAAGAAQDLTEGPLLDVDLPDDLREGHAGAFAPGHGPGDAPVGEALQGGGGRERGGHDGPIIMNMNFNFNSII